MRTLLHRFAEKGLEAAIRSRPAFPRTWTVTTLSEALAAAEDIHLKPRIVRFYLKRMGAQWRRTHASVRHQQDPELAAAAGATLAGLKKSARTRS